MQGEAKRRCVSAAEWSGTMAEVSFHKEIESLHLGAGDTFYGEASWP
jgi:hypothetical protein